MARTSGWGLLLMIACTAAAADTDPAALAACKAISQPQARLNCYDGLFGVVTTAAAASEASPAAFGLPRPAPAPDRAVTRIQARVRSIDVDGRQAVRVALDDGSVWLVLEPSPRVEAGELVTVENAALASFLLVTPDRHSYRVRRIR